MTDLRKNSDLFLGAGGDRVPPHGEGHQPGGPDPIPPYVGSVPVGDLSGAEGKVLGVVEGEVVPVSQTGGWEPPPSFEVTTEHLKFSTEHDPAIVRGLLADAEGFEWSAPPPGGNVSPQSISVTAGAVFVCTAGTGANGQPAQAPALVLADRDAKHVSISAPGAELAADGTSDGTVTLGCGLGTVLLSDLNNRTPTTENKTLVGAINELHRPLNVIEVELSPDGTIPATISDLFGPGWFIVSLIKAEKISGDCSAVTVRLLDGLTEVYKHAGADGTGNDLDTEAMTDRNVFSMENLSGNLTIEADSPAACVVKITLRVRAE